LSASNKILVSISACLAAGKYKPFKELVGTAIDQKVSVSKIYEVILQSYLFLGYPKALEGMKVLGGVLGNKSHVSSINYSFRNWSEWKIRGRVLCEKVYGKNFIPLQNRVGELSPELSEWMIVEGYGKVLSRGILAGTIRELCTVAALLVTSDVNQLHSHLRGAKNLGAGMNEIKITLQLASNYCNKQKYNRGLKLYNTIFKE
jgi:4-carboxymuconolactone decarboxylase